MTPEFVQPPEHKCAGGVRFAHESEQRFARILDFYGVEWEYEPVEFVLDWSDDLRPTSAFRPDFWLPRPGLFVEVTTLNQRLVTKKNGKVRRMAELYPEGSPCSTSATPWLSWPNTDWPATVPVGMLWPGPRDRSRR